MSDHSTTKRLASHHLALQYTVKFLVHFEWARRQTPLPKSGLKSSSHVLQRPDDEMAPVVCAGGARCGGGTHRKKHEAVSARKALLSHAQIDEAVAEHVMEEVSVIPHPGQSQLMFSFRCRGGERGIRQSESDTRLLYTYDILVFCWPSMVFKILRATMDGFRSISAACSDTGT